MERTDFWLGRSDWEQNDRGAKWPDTGGATYAYQAGVPEQLIKLHGDWCSGAFQVYSSLPLSTHTQMADIMAAGLFNKHVIVVSLLTE